MINVNGKCKEPKRAHQKRVLSSLRDLRRPSVKDKICGYMLDWASMGSPNPGQASIIFARC